VSNFGAPLPASGGLRGSLLSIDPSGSATLVVPANFDSNGDQEAALGGAVQMFSANSPHWLNSVNNPNAVTAQYAGVGNPLGLSNNNGFGRIWPANSPFGLDGKGSSSILDPTGLPLKGAPNPSIGGVYLGDLTNRNLVANPAQPQVIPRGASAAGEGWRQSGRRRRPGPGDPARRQQAGAGDRTSAARRRRDHRRFDSGYGVAAAHNAGGAHRAAQTRLCRDP
jgi:hypothetical protein